MSSPKTQVDYLKLRKSKCRIHGDAYSIYGTPLNNSKKLSFVIFEGFWAITLFLCASHCPAGEPSKSPKFPCVYIGNSSGSSLWKFSHDFPAEIQEQQRRILHVENFTSFPNRIPEDFHMDISTWKLPSCFLQNFKMQYHAIECENVPVMI